MPLRSRLLVAMRWLRMPVLLGATAMWAGVAESEHTHHRAGHPECQSACAAPTNSPRYCGGYVGGGTWAHGERRYPAEGTWGWDYRGHNPVRRIWLQWSHGRRYQGGSGSYRTD